ncbi:carbohydrate ABC transporter permease [Vallitalea okinawensis]|uniref:carbohydrate ABC transporter permease n=1 Tax=Vallitalea okinawensis TaxID=2078660 RepID=UPI00147962C2|nr:sugar ABC transporter permease [Vallitalea okinawensis]
MDRKTKIGYLFLLPAGLLMVIMVLYPVINTFYLSLFEYRVQTMALGKVFVGLENYKKIISDETFWNSFTWTVQFTFISVILELIIGMALALIMNRKIPGQSIIRTIILIPWAIPTIVSGMMWAYLFGQYGMINEILLNIGIIHESIPWFTEEMWAKTAIIIADVWKTTPYMSLLILGGLQTVPKTLYEAADIDGANIMQKFLKITLPSIKPALVIAVLFRVVAALRIYDLIAAMTSGGPAGTTESLSIYTVSTYFRFGNIGYGSALAVVMLIVSLLISLLFVDALKSKVDE